MKARTQFYLSEIKLLKKLIDEKNNSSSLIQKGIRAKIRRIGFYYSEFTRPSQGYTVAGFEYLIKSGQIEVIPEGQLNSFKSAPTETNIKSDLSELFIGESDINFKTIEDIEKAGFQGFKTIKELTLDCKCIPKINGVYMVLNFETSEFLEIGTGGFHKGKNPNVSDIILKNNWVEETCVVYIGKASDLRKRLNQYFKFGIGKNVGHYGGRYIWQLKNSQGLIVCWKSLPGENEDQIETNLIQHFIKIYNKRPFANLAK